MIWRVVCCRQERKVLVHPLSASALAIDIRGHKSDWAVSSRTGRYHKVRCHSCTLSRSLAALLAGTYRTCFCPAMTEPTSEQVEQLTRAFERFTRRFKVAEAAAAADNALNALDAQTLTYIDVNPGCGMGDVARYRTAPNVGSVVVSISSFRRCPAFACRDLLFLCGPSHLIAAALCGSRRV